jgi:hypothetical protein
MTAVKKTSAFVSLLDLVDQPIVPVQFAIEGLVRSDTPRPFCIAGKPEDGKSTDMAELAADVAMGRPYKGRKILRPGAVVWAGTEEDKDAMRLTFSKLGYNPRVHHPIYILDQSQYDGTTPKNPLEEIHGCVAEHPDVTMCLMETFNSFLNIKDLNDNSSTKEAFDRFHKIVAHDLYKRCAFGGILQMKKREGDIAGEMISGATEIRARLDAMIYIRSISDDDPRRKYMVKTRKGVNIPWSFLNFNPATGISELGSSVKAEQQAQRHRKKEETRDAIRTDITEYVLKHPDATQAEILSSPDVHGRTNSKHEMLKAGVENGWLSQSGSGASGDPYRYTFRELPMDAKKDQEKAA